jgi:hypothetical protein
MRADENWSTLQAHYQNILSSEEGWEPEPRLSEIDRLGISHTFAFKNGIYFIVIVGLEPAHAQGGFIPVNIITNIPEG